MPPRRLPIPPFHEMTPSAPAGIWPSWPVMTSNEDRHGALERSVGVEESLKG